ncbi:alpha/beta fold hydrolase [Streptomyces montanisoli]|uniref:Alpha/beta fold hydrolase n=1 Tax=Streptomyces montanisoli TaxID=2798581 RepID=A0A940MBL1_9ACTN|nr:alpha/beta fold hydrolase [Streptomyces montanisoli]MBP0457903.1 alpha/beta fold hydrolase [Streptomyces montanisoli]
MTDNAPVLHHEATGPEDAPVLLLGPSLGTSLDIWVPQLAALARAHRVIRYDLPGHGGSPASLLPRQEPGATTVADLAGLVLDLADRHGIGGFHYAGVSLGGAIGTYLAVHRPDRVASLALVCTSAHFGGAQPWRERAALVREKGMAPVAATAPARWFAHPETATTPRGAALLADHAAADPAGYAACCDALAAFDERPGLAAVTAPTQVVAGAGDVATPVSHGSELADSVPGARLDVVDGGHLAVVEEPAAVTELLVAHLARAERS